MPNPKHPQRHVSLDHSNAATRTTTARLSTTTVASDASQHCTSTAQADQRQRGPYPSQAVVQFQRVVQLLTHLRNDVPGAAAWPQTMMCPSATMVATAATANTICSATSAAVTVTARVVRRQRRQSGAVGVTGHCTQPRILIQCGQKERRHGQHAAVVV